MQILLAHGFGWLHEVVRLIALEFEYNDCVVFYTDKRIWTKHFHLILIDFILNMLIELDVLLKITIWIEQHKELKKKEQRETENRRDSRR
jgi:hypothetical protein